MKYTVNASSSSNSSSSSSSSIINSKTDICSKTNNLANINCRVSAISLDNVNGSNNDSVENDASPVTANNVTKAVIATKHSQQNTTTTMPPPNMLGSNYNNFMDQVNTINGIFEKWNECDRAIVMYALLKRLRYSSLKFLHYSIDNNLTQSLGVASNLSTVVMDMNANNPTYLQNLLNAYKTIHTNDLLDNQSSSSSDRDSISCYGSDFQMTYADERRIHANKEDVLHELLNIVPLLKPGNEEAKIIYMSFMPLVVKDTAKHILSVDLVQQIFSYMLIHPALSSDDRRSLTIWLRHLDDSMQPSLNCNTLNMGIHQPTVLLPYHNSIRSGQLLDSGLQMLNSASSGGSLSSSSCFSSVSSTTSNHPLSPSLNSINSNSNNSSTSVFVPTKPSSLKTNWQAIAPPNKQQHGMQKQQQSSQNSTNISHTSNWSCLVTKQSAVKNSVTTISHMADQLCDKLSGITLDNLHSSQNSLRVSIGSDLIDTLGHSLDVNGSSLVNGVAAAASAVSGSTLVATPPPVFDSENILNNSIAHRNCDHDTSFSKNGIEILDIDMNINNLAICDSYRNSGNTTVKVQPQQQQKNGYDEIPKNASNDYFNVNRWNVENKYNSLKTRRSNSLTTQMISSSVSSSNSSVVNVNDTCSTSIENLAQYANKPRSYSLSIEHHRGSLLNSGSDTRLDDFKPNYIKFQTRNVGMSGIGLWLKSLRLHKYIDLFKNVTYEEMLQITEEYLQSLGVTKGASHKLALCIDKLKERWNNLLNMEHDLLNCSLKLQSVAEELAGMVLTPMKPIEAVSAHSGENNIALLFLNVVNLACSIIEKESYAIMDDENINIMSWVIERMTFSEAFGGHINQIKEHKFKLSKLKISMTPKMHHSKNCNGSSNLNKSKWMNGKSRKSDQKNSSSDRNNYRKNSNDWQNFPLNILSHANGNDYDKYHCKKANATVNIGGNHSNKGYNHKYQQQQQSSMILLQNNFPALPKEHHQKLEALQTLTSPPITSSPQQRNSSLNTLIDKKGIAKQCVNTITAINTSSTSTIPTTSTVFNISQNTNSNAPTDMSEQTMRKCLLTSSISSGTTSLNSSSLQQHQPQEQQILQERTTATVVMVSKNHSSSSTNNNRDINNVINSQDKSFNNQKIKLIGFTTSVLNSNTTTIMSTAPLLLPTNTTNIHQISSYAKSITMTKTTISNPTSTELTTSIRTATPTLLPTSTTVTTPVLTPLHSMTTTTALTPSPMNLLVLNGGNQSIFKSDNSINCNGRAIRNNHKIAVSKSTIGNNVVGHCGAQTMLNLILPTLSEDCSMTTTTVITTAITTAAVPKSLSLSTTTNTIQNYSNDLNDIHSLQQLEKLCLQMTEQAIN